MLICLQTWDWTYIPYIEAKAYEHNDLLKAFMKHFVFGGSLWLKHRKTDPILCHILPFLSQTVLSNFLTIDGPATQQTCFWMTVSSFPNSSPYAEENSLPALNVSNSKPIVWVGVTVPVCCARGCIVRLKTWPHQVADLQWLRSLFGVQAAICLLKNGCHNYI